MTTTTKPTYPGAASAPVLAGTPLRGRRRAALVAVLALGACWAPQEEAQLLARADKIEDPWARYTALNDVHDPATHRNDLRCGSPMSSCRSEAECATHFRWSRELNEALKEAVVAHDSRALAHIFEDPSSTVYDDLRELAQPGYLAARRAREDAQRPERERASMMRCRDRCAPYDWQHSLDSCVCGHLRFVSVGED